LLVSSYDCFNMGWNRH